MSKDIDFIDQVITKLQESNPNMNSEITNSIAEAVTESVNDVKISAQKETVSVVLKLLGFENKWCDGWELDHCNGRSGNSFIGEELRGILQPQAAALVQELTKDIDWKKDINTKYQKQLLSSIHEEYNNHFNKEIRKIKNQIHIQAQADANKLFPHIVQTLFGKSYDEIRSDIVTGIIAGETSQQTLEKATSEMRDDEEFQKQMVEMINKMK